MISILVAIDGNFLIGANGKLPWNIEEELKLFKKLTEKNVVIMGRKTFESIGNPLKNRINIVISNTLKNYSDVIISDSLEKAISIAKTFEKEIFIIGGMEIYKEALSKNIADKLCISLIKKNYSGDVFFPKINFKKLIKIKDLEFKDFIYKEYILKFPQKKSCNFK